MSELVDRVAYALFRSKLDGLPPEAIERAWSTACLFKDECLADADVAVDAVLAWQRAPKVEVANDAARTRAEMMYSGAIPHSPAPLHFPLKAADTLHSAHGRGAVAGQPGWFWWEQVQPPGGRTIDYCKDGSWITHRIPSSQSPVGLAGLMWKLVE